jgi:hypothetical protein
LNKFNSNLIETCFGFIGFFGIQNGPKQFVLDLSDFERSNFMISHLKNYDKNIVALLKGRSHFEDHSNFGSPLTYWPEDLKSRRPP